MKKGRRRVAAIDIGSNTVHLSVFDSKSGSFEQTVSRSALLKLGCEVLNHDRFNPEVVEALEHVLEGHIKRATKAKAETILIGATGAFRRAENGQVVARELSRRLGRPVHLLRGSTEARLSFAGVVPDLLDGHHHLIIDSGGLSTELAVTSGRKLARVASLPVGAAIMTGLKHDPPRPLEWARLMVSVGETLKLVPDAPRRGFGRAIALGGAAHRFEELLGKKPGTPIHMEELELIATRLLSRSSKELGRKTGIEPERIALLSASSLIIGMVLQHYGVNEMQVSRRGLRDGMVQAYLKVGSGWWR